jgi:ABC-type multidrug transport system permease subunit
MKENATVDWLTSYSMTSLHALPSVAALYAWLVAALFAALAIWLCFVLVETVER